MYMKKESKIHTLKFTLVARPTTMSEAASRQNLPAMACGKNTALGTNTLTYGAKHKSTDSSHLHSASTITEILLEILEMHIRAMAV